MAAQTVEQLARSRVHDFLFHLSKLMIAYDLECTHWVPSCPHDWARHYGESDIRDGLGTIFHYRNLENERVHRDVYEFVHEFGTWYFEVVVDDNQVTEEERNWEA